MIRLLLDENLPRKLKWSLEGEVLTVPERGWSGVANGLLLQRAALEFDVLISMDRGMPYQQNLAGLELCLLLIAAPSNDLDDLLPLVPLINEALARAVPGQVIHVAAAGMA